MPITKRHRHQRGVKKSRRVKKVRRSRKGRKSMRKSTKRKTYRKYKIGGDREYECNLDIPDYDCNNNYGEKSTECNDYCNNLINRMQSPY